MLTRGVEIEAYLSFPIPSCKRVFRFGKRTLLRSLLLYAEPKKSLHCMNHNFQLEKTHQANCSTYIQLSTFMLSMLDRIYNTE